MSVCTNCGLANPPENKFCGACGTSLDPPAAAGGETRRTITVLFCDVTGSTSLGERLDAESLRRVMSRYFEDMKVVLERHGGTVEKFIGDAIMAVFGIPNLHEDDALRAVRAGVEMRSALEVLNQEVERERGVHIAVRTGINTGEVAAGDRSAAQTLITGDAVNVAARLEQSAQPGEILIGEKTAALVRDAAEVEVVEPMTVKGKRQPIRAFRLIAVKQGAPSFARHLDSPMVGRRDENALLGQAYQRAVKESSCHLFTLLGTAGVGKSRLVAEFLHGVGADATVLTGRCLSYGEGITFFPVVDMIKQAAGISEGHSLAEAIRRIESLLQKEPDAANIVERIGQLAGFTAASAASEEIFWAVRRLFESVAKERPLILLFDDLHWAEPTLVDLNEDLTDW
ncbi:MAG: AAA family ATPase, partial [Actinomycetota bacterium]|nr:AAA family ATPase [Actinomycetota bacterium]